MWIRGRSGRFVEVEAEVLVLVLVDEAVLFVVVALVVFELVLLFVLLVFEGRGVSALPGWDCVGSGAEKDVGEARKRRISLSNNEMAAIAVNAPCQCVGVSVQLLKHGYMRGWLYLP